MFSDPIPARSRRLASQLRQRTRIFSGGDLLQIAMPMGGIGAGAICLNGYGGIQDLSIRNKPGTTALPDGHAVLQECACALLHIKGTNAVTKLVEGPMSPEKLYDQGLQAQGYRHCGHEGLPRFRDCTFTAEYPFGQVRLSHPAVPLLATVTGFSPLIPLDDKNSGIPCALLEYTFHNPTDQTVEFDFSYHLSHLAVGKAGSKGSRNRAIAGFGNHFTNTQQPNHETFGSAFLGVIGHTPRLKGMWLRSGWFDWLNALWREVSTGTFTENSGSSDEDVDGNNGGSVLLDGKLAPGESITYPIVIAWHFPNVHQTCGQLAPEPCCAPGSGCGEKAGEEDPAPTWRPYYVSQWRDAAAVAGYVRDNYATLRARTRAFRDALASSTVAPAVLDAVSSNLAILKSPTVLRQENGNIWAWEGCFTTTGCCHGSCTHVWNYAQSLPHLFPQLERTLREQELLRSLRQDGHVAFRAALPDGPTAHDSHAAADGQLGGIMKVYREWQISGDRAWLEKLYPATKSSLNYCIQTWDPEERGAVIEPHHNTYDIEFWGPDGMCTSIYLGALTAGAAMARELGHSDEAQRYEDIAGRGAKFMDAELFNGEYYQQKVQWRELRDQSFAKQIENVTDQSTEILRLLKAEGPKYQYGSGCLSDGVIGAWMARIYGIDTPQTRGHTRKSLAAIYRHNFKADLSDHACTQRPGYANGNEPGLLVCSWPRGDKPTLPFVYCDEVWTGMEYQVASHLIEEGLVDEGLTVVRAARSRYEGHVRNPFNEYECGSYYARAMSSYALLISLTGFRYSAASQTLWLAPKQAGAIFRAFFCAASGYGVVTLSAGKLTIKMVEGELKVGRLVLDHAGRQVEVTVAKTAQVGRGVVVKLPGVAQ